MIRYQRVNILISILSIECNGKLFLKNLKKKKKKKNYKKIKIFFEKLQKLQKMFEKFKLTFTIIC